MHDRDIEIYKDIRKAIKEDRLSDVVQLIANDSSRLQLDTPFGTWLHMAAAHGKLEIAQWLVAKVLI